MRDMIAVRMLAMFAVLVTLGQSLGAWQLMIPPRVSKIDERDYDMKTFATSTLSESEWAGGALFDQRCAMCHSQRPGVRSSGPTLTQATVSARGENVVREKILQGSARMPGWADTFTSEQVSNLIAYLKTVDAAKRER